MPFLFLLSAFLPTGALPAPPYALQHVSIVWQDLQLTSRQTKYPFDVLSVTYNSVATMIIGIHAPSVETLQLKTGCSTPVITDSQGNPLSPVDTATSRNGVLAVRLSRPASAGDTLQVIVRCHFSEVTTSGYLLRTNEPQQRPEGVSAPFQYAIMFAAGQVPNVNVSLNSPPRITWDFTATVPSGYQAVSNGRMVSDVPASDGHHTVHWQQDHLSEISAFMVSIGTYTLIREQWQDSSGRIVPLIVAVPSTQDTTGARLFARDAVQGLELFSRLTGVTYPWGGRQFVAGFGRGGGINVASFTHFSRWDQYEEHWSGLPDVKVFYDRPRTTNSVLFHEMAHDWFGSLVSANGNQLWLSEGLADYLTAQYLGFRWGPRAEQEFLYFYNLPNQDPKVRGALVPLDDNGGQSIQPYGGGAYVLNVLRRYLGDQKFWAGIQAYLRANEGLHPTSEDFRRALEGVAREDLRWFFNQWVYGDRRPAFAVSAAYDAKARRVTLQVEQTQGPVRFTTPAPSGGGLIRDSLDFFRMPITVRVAMAKGSVSKSTQLTSRVQTIIIDSVPSAPTMVLFDSEDGIWKTLNFPQPTAWLAAQLTGDPSVWQTWWAIQQLRTLAPVDSSAASALIRATTSGRHTITRALAVEALDTLSFSNVQASSSVLPTLQVALRDTAVRVRRAAAKTLRWWPASDVVPVVRAIGATETSFVVRMQLYQSLKQIAGISTEDRQSLAQTLRVPFQ